MAWNVQSSAAITPRAATTEYFHLRLAAASYRCCTYVCLLTCASVVFEGELDLAIERALVWAEVERLELSAEDGGVAIDVNRRLASKVGTHTQSCPVDGSCTCVTSLRANTIIKRGDNATSTVSNIIVLPIEGWRNALNMLSSDLRTQHVQLIHAVYMCACLWFVQRETKKGNCLAWSN